MEQKQLTDFFGKLNMGAALVLLLLSQVSLAQVPVVIDDWTDPHSTRVDSAASPPDPNPNTQTVGPSNSILGGYRDIWVRRNQATGAVTSRSEAGILEHIQGSTASGTSRLKWDGDTPSANPPVLDANNNVDVSDPENGLDPLGLGEEDGLGIVNLVGFCGGGADGFALTMLPDNFNPVTITINVYSAADRWSSKTKTVPPGVLEIPLSFLFANFTAQGQNGTQGAMFDRVGAIEMVLSSADLASDIFIRTPLALCGYDFGSATDQLSLSSTLDGTFFYPTLIEPRAVNVEVNFGPPVGVIDFGPTPALRGPHHRVGGPWMGLEENDTDSEPDGQPCPIGQNPTAPVATCGDNAVEVADEDAVTFSSTWIDGEIIEDLLFCDGLQVRRDQYCVAVEVTNPTDISAVIAGWIDFERNGFFRYQNCDTSGLVALTGGSGPSPFSVGGCERSAAALALGNTGLSQFDASGPACNDEDPIISDGSFASGNIPPNCTGVVVLIWDMSDFADNEFWNVTTDTTWSRFRITTDRSVREAIGTQPEINFFSNAVGSGPVPFGRVEDGEVEDHIIDPGTIPVSIHAFESQFTREGLEVVWSTASETTNKGFFIWGETSRGGFELLTPEMIHSTATDLVKPQQYRVVIPGLRAGSIRDLVITAVDYSGNEDMYGYFRVGDAYGQENPADPIDWAAIRAETDDRLARAGFESRGDIIHRAASGRAQVRAADFAVAQAGMQRVTHDDLLKAGLNLAGVNPADIAVTMNGQPVQRKIDLGASTGSRFSRSAAGPEFGPGSAIYFWGEAPSFPEARYVDELVYRITVDSGKVAEASEFRGSLVAPSSRAWNTARVAENVAYNPSNPNEDPWFMRELNSNVSSQRSYVAEFQLDRAGGASETASTASLAVRVGGLTAPPQSPNHRLKLFVNGVEVEDFSFGGQQSKLITASFDAGLLRNGSNSVEVRSIGFPGISSVVLLDSVELTWSAELNATEGRALGRPLFSTARSSAVSVRGLDAADGPRAFAYHDGQLFDLQTLQIGRGVVTVAVPRAELGADGMVWASGTRGFHQPRLLGTVSDNNQLDDVGEFVVVAHPAFMPMNEREQHPLNSFIDHRRAQGWTVSLHSIGDIQMHYGGGMPLPGALTSFLADARQLGGASHVLLVGGDSFDYRDHYGMGSLSFIPTVYAPTSFVNHTPSDGLLADLTGNGVADVALGRWPVRTGAELAASVQKVFDWESNVAPLQSSVWVTDARDPRVASFSAQADRMSSRLIDAGWAESAVEQIIFEDFASASPTAPAGMRSALFSALEEGRTLTGFSGHGSPTLWSFEGILRPSDVAALNNEGMPTMISTLACYTTYFASPNSNTLAHRLMNGYRIDSAGNPVSGVTNGAVAIHGAATLSNLAQNEVFMREVLDAKLSGMTLGESVLQARQMAAQRRINDLVVNWILLGDPTLRLH